MPTAFELAKLQEHAYAVAKALNSGLPLPEGGPDALNWTLLRDIPLDLLRDKASGYNGAVYFNAAGELAIVHVGTQEFRDLVADGGIALKILPKGQLDAANALVDFVRGQTELRDATIWQTGHSLGGLLAELSTASQLTRNFDENMYALTIASPGGSAFMKAIGADPDIDYASRMTNIYRAMDPVGTLGRHIGTEIQLGDGRTYWQTEGLFMPIPLLGEALFAKRVVTDHLLSNYESALSQQDVELRPVAAPLAPTAASGVVTNATINWFDTLSAPPELGFVEPPPPPPAPAPPGPALVELSPPPPVVPATADEEGISAQVAAAAQAALNATVGVVAGPQGPLGVDVNGNITGPVAIDANGNVVGIGVLGGPGNGTGLSSGEGGATGTGPSGAGVGTSSGASTSSDSSGSGDPSDAGASTAGGNGGGGGGGDGGGGGSSVVAAGDGAATADLPSTQVPAPAVDSTSSPSTSSGASTLSSSSGSGDPSDAGASTAGGGFLPTVPDRPDPVVSPPPSPVPPDDPSSQVSGPDPGTFVAASPPPPAPEVPPPVFVPPPSPVPDDPFSHVFGPDFGTGTFDPGFGVPFPPPPVFAPPPIFAPPPVFAPPPISFDFFGGSNFFGGFDFFGGDPVVLDLNHDGVLLQPAAKDGVVFDLNGDGFVERTAWVQPEDGLLALDRDHDGKITSGRELFSEFFDPARATTGLGALALFDANHDGVIDAKDPVFGQLQVWRDANHDARTDPGELPTLDALGITAIQLAGRPANEPVDGGRIITRTTFIQNGTARDAADVFFATESESVRSAAVTAAAPNGEAINLAADGHELDDKRVEQLRQAMATFAPPALSADMTLSSDLQHQLTPVLAGASQSGHGHS